MMPEFLYSDYERDVARAIASHPDVVCLDAMLIFSKGTWLDGEDVEEDDFSDTTYKVEVVRLWLLDEKKSEMLNMKFGKKYEFTVYSSKADFFPRPNDYIVDAFPITRDDVIQIAKRYLSASEYSKERNSFLFGHELIQISE